MKFRNFLQEQKKEKHAVMAFGRMNPPTVGHEKLVDKVREIARNVGGSAHIVVSHSQDAKKNPLSPAQKVKHAKRAFPGVNVSASDASAPNFLAQAAKLHKAGVTHFYMVGGSDRVEEFKKLLTKYNGVKGPHGHFNFKHIEVHSAGDRDPDAEGVEGMSASKMREHATNGNFKEFRKGVPSRMTDAHAKELYNHVRGGMGIKESVNEEFQELLTEGVHDQSIFKAVFLAGGPGSGKDYVLDNTLAGHGLTEINSDKALEFLMDKQGLDKTMPASEKEKRDIVRGRAKSMTELRQRLALLGRNGLIINGTGDDLEKITRIKKGLEDLGYDTSMVMVNTSDEVSAQRNIERGQRGGRTVPETIRKEKWDSAQDARTEYAKMFGDNYMEFDNSEDLRNAPPEVVKQKKDEMLQLFTNVKNFVSTPPSSEQAQAWVAHQLDQKDTLPVKKDGPEMMPHPESNAAEEAKKLGLQYYGFGRYGRNGEVTHRSVHDKLVEVQKQIKENIDEELLDEFRTIDSYSKKELDDKFKEFTKNKGRFRKLIRTPLSNDFDVYYSGAGDFHKYIFTEKNTDVAVGEFELDVVDYIRPEFVKPGIKIVTPHLFFSEKYQRKGLARKTYLAFLRMKNYVFMTDRHTQEAATLWNSLAKERDITTFYYDDREEEVSKHTEHEYKFLGLKSDFKLPKHILEDINELFAEDLRNWFSKSHPEGGWKRINSKGEAIGPCAREPGEPKPKCMSNEKRAALSKKERAAAVRAKRKHDPNPERKGDPINVSNFGKGKISESYALSDSSAMNLLLLGNDVDEQNLYFNGENDNYDFSEEASKVKLLRDKSGKVRTFMLRRAAAKEAHTINGTVMPYKNGYVIKLNEENNHVRISEESVQTKTIDRWRQTSIGRINSSRGEKILNEGVAELTSGQEYAKGTGIETTPTQASGQGKITLQQIRQRKTVLQKERERSGSSVSEDTEQINEIDKGIELGLSMATGGENATRLAPKNKAVKKPFEEAIGAGGEMATSMGDNEELKLKRKGIDLQSFKAKRPIG